MHCPIVDLCARRTLLLVGSVTIWLALQSTSPAQTQTSATVVQSVGITPVMVPPINVPRITVPPITVQVQGARSAGGQAKAQTASAKAVSVTDQSQAASEADAEGEPQSSVYQPIGSRIGITPPAAGSILQLINATEPIDGTMGPLFPAPPPERLPLTDPSPTQEWTSPYQTGPLEDPTRKGWYRCVPRGMLPWGPRTPLADRALGWGEPLLGTSWLNRPWSAGWFAGGIFGTPLEHQFVKQKGGFYGGYRLGWDYDYYWGLEARLGASSISLEEPLLIGRQPGTNDFWNLDLNLHWYFLGDSRWRPYLSAGFGMANFAFWDPNGNHFDQVQLATPLGIGLKYRWLNWVAFRADLMDNVAYARNPVDTVNYFSFSFGVEMQFGGVRRTYWPWNPGKVIH